MKGVNARVRSMTDEEIRSYIETGHVSFEVEGESILLQAEDLDVTSEGVEGWLVGQEDGVTVALDTTVDEELRSEGYAREIVNRVQNMRKSADFDVTDRIHVGFLATPDLALAWSGTRR
jgi:isoleucyl-tRNA synthetase